MMDFSRSAGESSISVTVRGFSGSGYLASVLADVVAERARQVQLGYTHEHDMEHTHEYFVRLVESYLNRSHVTDPRESDRRLIQATASAVAALEASYAAADGQPH